MPLQSARNAADVSSRLQHFLLGDKTGDQPMDPSARIAGAQPYRHSYYVPEQFFLRESGTGVIQNIYGQRVVLVTSLFFPALIRSLQGLDGHSAERLLYRCGFRWGQTEMASFPPRVQHEFKVEFEKLNMSVMLETWWWPFRIEGWGDWRFNFQYARNGLIFVDLFDSALAAAMGHTGRCVCHLYSGLYAAVFSHLAKRDLGCVELQCTSRGDKHCHFLIALPKRIDAAGRWRDQGLGLEMIIKQLDAIT
jgi:predicted hydrocarbon binding protein